MARASLSPGEVRLLSAIRSWKDEGRDGLPTVDEALAYEPTIPGRGASSRAYARLQKRGMVDRTGHSWSTGRLTETGERASLFARNAAVPTKLRAKRAPVWKHGMPMQTLHPDKVRSARGDSMVLKHGIGIKKLGPSVTKGWLKGAKIFYLTLEERRTCPASCKLLDLCYGNAMPFAVRYAFTGDLIEALDHQLRAIDRRIRNNHASVEYDRVLVRLHELGDFGSPEYVHAWDHWLAKYDWLHVFGFTAWEDATEIGAEIAKTKYRFGRRFSIRWSGVAGVDGAVVVKHGSPAPVSTFKCPEQLGRVQNCGACGACWSTPKAVAFTEH